MTNTSEQLLKTQSYTAYGLTIRSSIPLTEFISHAAEDAQVSVSFGQDSDWVARVREQLRVFEVYRPEARFWFKGVGGFVVKHGSQIIAIPEDGIDNTLLRLYIEGMMMAVVLHQRGMCVVHASVIEVNGVAVALSGHVGAGKSSLAAALYSRGHRILADDNAAINLVTGTPMVVPAYPYMKLFPEIASCLGFKNGSLSILHPSQTKITGAVTNGFIQKPLPLQRIYVLGRDHPSAVSPLSPSETILELIRNSVPTRWGHVGDAQQLQQCGSIAKRVPAFRLKTFTDLGSLSTLAESLERHCAEPADATGSTERSTDRA